MKAPDFNLINAQTNEFVSLSDYQGKPVMITFWVSWCPDCQKDLPKKTNFYQTMDHDALAFLTINVTGREADAANGVEFMNNHELPFPVLKDNGTTTYDDYQCSGVPTTVILDQQHNIFDSFGDKASFYEIIRSLSMVMK
ncbi:TlpA disulfide reductase family protein [Tuberibacillus sp. Marseille-P3662]|uniref:TlpA disulfide reductase family protein n=1 Tax=Tuberibacillus sp. Marseille-P3662 TaxID=1965358 RepID=UPI000A1CB36A|nr:TlpA disulfide reductase family protein [Tuberibacillus sp. Marseille-P3662]